MQSKISKKNQWAVAIADSDPERVELSGGSFSPSPQSLQIVSQNMATGLRVHGK